MERGRSKDPGMQERLDNYKAQFKNGKKKWVRYDEGAILYSLIFAGIMAILMAVVVVQDFCDDMLEKISML